MVEITKQARLKKLHRGNWYYYYTLFCTFSRCNSRILPNAQNIELLVHAIANFWKIVFPDAPKPARALILFTAVCVSELASGDNPIFPLIPWLQGTVPAHASIYSQCLPVSCRSMTALLMQINDIRKTSKPQLVFPVN